MRLEFRIPGIWMDFGISARVLRVFGASATGTVEHSRGSKGVFAFATLGDWAFHVPKP